MAPALERSARHGVGGAAEERPGLGSAQQSRLAAFARFRLPTQLGAGRAEGRASGWARPLAGPSPARAAQVRAPRSSPGPREGRQLTFDPQPAPHFMSL